MPKKTTIALLYDFDKTLCTRDMQEYSFTSKVGMDAKAFWAEANSLAQTQKMDGILAYMYQMLVKSKASRQSIRREDFVSLGGDLELFPGVETWFERINRAGAALGACVEHYIISSGLREIIEGSCIYPYFKEVYACEFLYDENGVACWPKNAVNYTTKTQFLFRINKGVLDISDDKSLNRYTPEDERPIPFRNMIYIGDGLTDVPCMKLVKANGGFSIAVHPRRQRQKVTELLEHGRVDYLALADYSEGSDLDTTVREMIRQIAATDILREKSNMQRRDLQKRSMGKARIVNKRLVRTE